jgi:hypothetical protein
MRPFSEGFIALQPPSSYSATEKTKSASTLHARTRPSLKERRPAGGEVLTKVLSAARLAGSFTTTPLGVSFSDEAQSSEVHHKLMTPEPRVLVATKPTDEALRQRRNLVRNSDES